MKVSIAVQVYDKPGPRAKEGDIIAVKPEGHQWGKKEVEQFLILDVELPLSATYDKAVILTSEYRSNGVLNWESEEPPELVAKRRFRIDMIALKDILKQAKLVVDWQRVTDLRDAYQPLSAQVNAPGGDKITFDPTKVAEDKYLDRKLQATDFSTFIG